MQAALEGNPLYFLLGGMAGLLPDTLDFKVGRYLHRPDVQVVPDPTNPDPKQIARAVSEAIVVAHDSGRPVTVALSTIRVGAGRWRAYEVLLDVMRRRVAVRMGPTVDTGGKRLSGAWEPRARAAQAALPCGLRIDYQAATVVDILRGPVFTMTPASDGRVAALFIPWHRSWSHSLVTALLVGIAAGLVWGVTAGAVVFGAYGAHALLDQFGFMGSNLFWPYTGRRFPGWQLVGSGHTLANVSVVWSVCLLVFWNLWRLHAPELTAFAFPKLIVLGLALPLGLATMLKRRLRR